MRPTKIIYNSIIRNLYLLLLTIALASAQNAFAQCTVLGDQSTYGTNNTWIGYVYQGKTFTTYKGYVNEGTAGNSNFDESFGGDQVTYNTNGCSITTDNFSVRYKLTQTFANGNYLFTVGGDDGYRLSLDGGVTWAINDWNDQSYTTNTYTVALNGTYNMVLEYYENSGQNRISFNVAAICTGTGDPTVYGTNNVWQAYIYQGMNFNLYKGLVTEGSAMNPNFDENFGTSGNTPIAFSTNSCSIQTAQFSARYRLKQTLTSAKYVFTVGGDDGYRFSLDGGNTWVINNWSDHGYTSSTYTATLNGTYNMVLEYYQNGGNQRVTFSMSSTLLPITLISWTGATPAAGQEQLQWKCTDAVNFDHFEIERSMDGESFISIHTTPAIDGGDASYHYTDQYSYAGTAYYRLAMVDKDGNTAYSNILTLSQKDGSGARVYPTVVENGSIYVETPSSSYQTRLELFDMSGRKLTETSVTSGRQQVSLSGAGHGSLTAGAYLIRITANNLVLAKQIIIVK
jgi:hypothetical protein